MIKVVNTINKGSFSTVYLTDENDVYKHFSSKKILGYLFIPLEISVLRTLEHVNISPNIINYVCNKNKITGYTMERYDYDLYYFITKKYSNGIAVEQKKNIFYQLLNAVYYLHEINIVHCDIKPANIMIDNRHNAFLCDFNSCHLMTPKKIESLCNLYTCTLWYRSPEILLNKPITYKCDIWSLGVVFSELLKGECGVLTKGYFYGEDNALTSSFIYKNQCEYFMHDNYVTFFKFIGLCEDDNLCELLKNMLTIDPFSRYCSKMLLDQACFTDTVIKKPTISPLMNIENSNYFHKNSINIVCFDYAIVYIKDTIKQYVKTSYRYFSLKLFHEELLHFAHYIFIYSYSYNYDSSMIVNKFFWCLILALKIMDPYNDMLCTIDVSSLNIEEETFLLIETDFKIYFQNSVYYKIYNSIVEPSSSLLVLLDASLYFNYPKSCKNTNDVMQLLINFSEGKNTDSTYYTNLQKFVIKNECIN